MVIAVQLLHVMTDVKLGPMLNTMVCVAPVAYTVLGTYWNLNFGQLLMLRTCYAHGTHIKILILSKPLFKFPHFCTTLKESKCTMPLKVQNTERIALVLAVSHSLGDKALLLSC